KGNIAADCGDAYAVAVRRDTGDDAVEKVAIPSRVERTEAEGVEDRDGSCTHCENVADDAADSGRGALERLDRARVVMRLHLHGDCEAIADVDDPGVLTRPLKHPGRLCGEELEQRLRILIAAVLAPHGAEHAEL